MKNSLKLYLEYLSNEQVSAAGGIFGIDSIHSGKPFRMPEPDEKDDDKEDEDQD